jgi:hypothetical protein
MLICAIVDRSDLYMHCCVSVVSCGFALVRRQSLYILVGLVWNVALGVTQLD